MTDDDKDDDVSEYTRRKQELQAAIKLLIERFPRENVPDECYMLRQFNPLLESDVDAPVRLRQVVRFCADFILCCNNPHTVLSGLDAREGFGWILETVAQTMKAHEALLGSMSPRPEPSHVGPVFLAMRDPVKRALILDVVNGGVQ